PRDQGALQVLMSDSVENSSENLQRALVAGESMIREVFEDWQTTSAGFAHRFEQAADISGRVAESMSALPEAVDRLNAGIDTLLARQADDTDTNPNVMDTQDVENDALPTEDVVSRRRAATCHSRRLRSPDGSSQTCSWPSSSSPSVWTRARSMRRVRTPSRRHRRRPVKRASKNPCRTASNWTLSSSS